MNEPSKVWIVTRWVWGGGGDDDREIVGVYGSEATAHAAAESSDAISEHDVLRPVVGNAR